MASVHLEKDPYNIIITGVGGQGNVTASRVLANMFVRKGFMVTVGETFGASQRGGSVMSHVRISADSTFSPQIPMGKADLVVSLEPSEALRVLQHYGNPRVKVLTNSRPIYSSGVIAGEMKYPTIAEMKETLQGVSESFWFIDATEEAVKLGNPVLGNVIMIGAVAGIGVLPITRDDFNEIMMMTMPANKLEINLKAFDIGSKLVKLSH
jgi:indolepyruvate ferredoxin oxidoreductase beta subunit